MQHLSLNFNKTFVFQTYTKSTINKHSCNNRGSKEQRYQDDTATQWFVIMLCYFVFPDPGFILLKAFDVLHNLMYNTVVAKEVY